MPQLSELLPTYLSKGNVRAILANPGIHTYLPSLIGNCVKTQLPLFTNPGFVKKFSCRLPVLL